jgi:hypothetical protein
MQKISWSTKLKEFQWSALSALIAALALWLTTYQSILNRQVTQMGTQAWVGVVGVQQHFKIGEPPQIILLLKNSGKTPASDVKVYSGKQIVSRNTDGPILVAQMAQKIDQFFKDSPNDFSYLGTIPQDAAPSFAMNFPPQENLNPVRRGDNVLYVVGKFIYTDVFAKTHETHFCYWSQAAETAEMRLCGTENTMK